MRDRNRSLSYRAVRRIAEPTTPRRPTAVCATLSMLGGARLHPSSLHSSLHSSAASRFLIISVTLSAEQKRGAKHSCNRNDAIFHLPPREHTHRTSAVGGGGKVPIRIQGKGGCVNLILFIWGKCWQGDVICGRYLKRATPYHNREHKVASFHTLHRKEASKTGKTRPTNVYV